MTTPSGQISFQDLINEFGNPGGGNNDLGSFRRNDDVHGEFYRIAENVPKSGQIGFADLRNKSLHVIVNVNGGTKINAKDKWTDTDTTVIGGGTDKKQNGSRIIIHVRGTLQSERGTHERGSDGNGNRWTCALKTGGWGSARSVDIIVGPGNNDGHIRGGGGEGGRGGESNGNDENDEQADAENGSDGTSALGIEHNIRNLTVKRGSTIYAGGGGGGGGGGAGGELSQSDERTGGGGGGGGMGTPSGNGGQKGEGEVSGDNSRDSQNGQNGSANEGGNGGRGGLNNEGEGAQSAQGGGGGGGGGISIGEGGEGERGAQNGFDGVDMDNNNPGNFDERGAGGNGGEGDAEGEGQQEGEGGLAGHHGGAIVRSGYNITSISGGERIYGVHNTGNSPT